MNENEIGTAVVGRGFVVERQKPIAITYESLQLDDAYRADLLVNGKVIVEVKSVETRHPVHRKQLLTYLKLSGVRLGYLINFNEYLVKDGIERLVNGLPESSFSAPSASLRETSSP